MNLQIFYNWMHRRTHVLFKKNEIDETYNLLKFN